MVNAVTLNKRFDSARPSLNTATCSFSVTASAPVTLFNGTGLYTGISGKITITGVFAAVGPRLRNGKCNMSNKATPLAQYQSIQGSGSVSFS
jgi:hypothetical protein